MISSNLSFVLMALGAVHQVTSHMEMTSPPPRRSKHNRNNNGEIDYSYTAPLGPDYSYPCRGFKAGKPSLEVKAGSSIPVQLAGGANHNGGHCQFSVSYDEQNWVVLKSVYGNCLTGSLNYDVQIPSDAPNGRVTFGWTWINRTGNREYYMNCADINITGGKDGGSFTGITPTIANLPGYETFPEGFANDYKKSEMESTPKKTISPSGSQGGPSNQGQVGNPIHNSNNQNKNTNNSVDNGNSQKENNNNTPVSSNTQQPTQVPPVSQPTSDSGNNPPSSPGGKCNKNGELKCVDNNLHICIEGTILVQVCPKTAPCKPYSGSFACSTN